MIPLYSDEILFKMMQAAAFVNDGNLVNLLPQCDAGIALPLPLSWYPAALIYQLLYQGLSPLMIRASGVFIALFFVGFSAICLRLIAKNQGSSQYVATLFLAGIGVGLIPTTLVLSRPEQWLLLCLSYFILCPLLYLKSKPSHRFFLPKFLLYCICTSLIFYAHPKSLFFIPVVLTSGLIIFRGNRIYQVAALGLSVFCALQTFLFSKEAMICSKAPIAASFIASQTLNIAEFIHQPKVLFNLFYIYLSAFPEKAIQYSIFRNEYFVNWLPSLPEGEVLNGLPIFINGVIYYFIYALFFAGLVMPIISLLAAIFARRVGLFHLMIAAVWVSVIGHLILYVNYNFYAVSLVIGILIILALLSAIDIPWPKCRRIPGYLVYFLVFSLFILSAFVNITTLVPRLVEPLNSWQGLQVYGQPSSVQTFHYSDQRERVRKLARSCGITGDGTKHLVVDNLTYFAFDNLHEPMHLANISEKGSGQDIKQDDFLSFLDGMRSPGIVGRCWLFPDSVRRAANEDDGICCLGLNR
jgi:hypothetical protein